ncbi:hypothetical protein [Mycobacterium sp. MMS18-G62]
MREPVAVGLDAAGVEDLGAPHAADVVGPELAPVRWERSRD